MPRPRAPGQDQPWNSVTPCSLAGEEADRIPAAEAAEGRQPTDPKSAQSAGRSEGPG